MINLRNNKGVTLVTEVLTIVILMMILAVISYSSTTSLQIRKLNNMYADIINIQEKAANYYLKYGEAPVTEEQIDITSTVNLPTDQINPNDEAGAYYKVDFSKLLNVTLNNKQTAEEYYFMNTKTLTTYFSEGIKVDESNNGSETTKVFYTLRENYENVNKIEIEDYQN